MLLPTALAFKAAIDHWAFVDASSAILLAKSHTQHEVKGPEAFS
jgi:hypothetical protein